MPKSTAWIRLHASPADPKSSNRYAFTHDEGKLIVDLFFQHADRGALLCSRHIQVAAEIVIEKMPEECRSRLPFRDGWPERDGFVVCMDDSDLRSTILCRDITKPSDIKRSALTSMRLILQH